MVFLFKSSGEVVSIVVTHAVGYLCEAEISADEQLLAALESKLLQVLQRRVARVFLEDSSEFGVSHVDGISDICGSYLLAEFLGHNDFSLMDGFSGLLIFKGVVAVKAWKIGSRGRKKPLLTRLSMFSPLKPIQYSSHPVASSG